MSKFKTLVENLLIEYDRDDPSDNIWLAAKQNKEEWLQKKKLAKDLEIIDKTIPLPKREYAYIKVITKSNLNQKPTITYLTGNKEFPYTYFKEKAKKFDKITAEYFVKNHKEPVVTCDKLNPEIEYQRIFEIENI